MNRRASLTTAAASYAQLASTVITGLVSVPLALKFLDDERLGLWNFTLQSLGYFLLLDLGVTSSAGRLMAEPIHRGDTRECNRWFSLFTIILTVQGLLIFVVGWSLLDSVMNWFSIEAHLRTEARRLWLLMLGLNSVTFPVRISGGILFAQNRYYWVSLSSTAGLWLGLLGFFIFLKNGTSSLAYGYSSILTMVLSYGVPWLAMKRGPLQFKFSWSSLRWADLRELFNYSLSVFVIGLTIQVVFTSQTLVIKYLLSLSAVALFTISSKVGSLGLQLLWRTFDALNPGWQQLYVAGRHSHLAGSFRRYTELTMSLALMGCTCLIALNGPFVCVWAKPGLYGGAAFDVFLAIYVLQHTWNHCLAFPVGVAKVVRPLAVLGVLEMVLNIWISLVLVPKIGVGGVLVGGILGSLATSAYLTLKAPAYLSLSAKNLVPSSIVPWLGLGGCVCLASFWVISSPDPAKYLWVRGLLCLLACGLFLLFYRGDLKEFYDRAKVRFFPQPAAAPSPTLSEP